MEIDEKEDSAATKLSLETPSSIEFKKTSDLLYDSENPEDFGSMGIMELGPKQVLRCRYFYLLWLLMFCNIIPITLLTSTFKIPICVMLLIWSASLFIFPNVFLWPAASQYVYGIVVCLMFFCMSGVFGIMPAATRILFGNQNMATTYGMVFSAFSVGSLISAAAAQVAKGAWKELYYASGSVCIVAFFVVLFIFDPTMPFRCRPWFACARTDHRR
ncbi:unnamed protein product [Dibothriocephalus latus]|uniref:Major facilitator superfamily (MFS) profile domain-containing protein n=1 Tax=Dibothriocephalus latus TaxID=60516 RepID=A0A3P7LLV5_DIBLA|nr:unnamed protein product [Dibothriocephalus latus]